MQPAVSLRDVGIKFRDPRQGLRGRDIPRLLGRGRAPFWGIRHVTLELRPGEVVGLIGPNGSGKSTLLRTVAAIYRPDEGQAVVRGRVAPMLSATAGLEVGLSGWHNVELSAVLLGLTRDEARQIAPAVAEFADIGRFMNAPVRVYSAGMRARLGFAIAVSTDPDVLLLDEVVSVGDEEFRERSSARIREFIGAGRTVLIASHDVTAIAELCDRMVRLEHGRVADEGDPDEVAARYLKEHGGLDQATHRAAGGGRHIPSPEDGDERNGGRDRG